MHFDIIFSDAATETFEAIGQQILIKWGERELNEFRKRVYKVIEVITKFPLIFQAVNSTENVRKAFIHKNCSMFYSISDAYIKILFFWDNRQEPIF